MRLALIAGRELFFALALPIALVALWWWLSADNTSIFWPPLSEIVATFPDVWTLDRVFDVIVPSVARLVVGYLLALLVGIALGTLIGLRRGVRAFLEPTLEFFRAIPPPLLIPLLALFIGFTGSTPKIAAIALGALWPVLLNTVEGVRGIDEVMTDTARSYRLRTRTRLTTVVLRGASPQIAAGARQALSIGVIMMVIGELFGANSGLGSTLVQFRRQYAIAETWTVIFVLGLIGVTLSIVFRIVEHRVLAWYRGQRRADRGV